MTSEPEVGALLGRENTSYEVSDIHYGDRALVESILHKLLSAVSAFFKPTIYKNSPDDAIGHAKQVATGPFSGRITHVQRITLHVRVRCLGLSD